jgi:hypothetical protein
VRVCCCGGATDFVRRPPNPVPVLSLSGAIFFGQECLGRGRSGYAIASIYLGPAPGA